MFMKKVLITVAVIAIVSLSFTSCKKEKARTTSEKIVGVWHLNNYIYNEHYDGADHLENNSGGPNDTYEFKANGTVNSNVGGSSDSSSYSIVGDNKLLITEDENYDIKKLDDHNLVLYFKEMDGDEFVEITITLTR